MNVTPLLIYKLRLIVITSLLTHPLGVPRASSQESHDQLNFVSASPYYQYVIISNAFPQIITAVTS